MEFLGPLFAFSQAIGFKIEELTGRRIQERGVSPAGVFSLYRYALIPALLWSIFFVHSSDVGYVLHNPLLAGYIAFIAVTWNLQMFLWSHILNKVSSMTALATLQSLLYLPLLLVIGALLNHDVPSVWSILAAGVLMLAFAIQPTHHHENTRARFALPVAAIVGLALLTTILNALNNGASREALRLLAPEAFLGIFSVTTMALCWIWTLFASGKPGDRPLVRRHWRSALVIPLLWFLASVPETYGFAALPIYTVVSIGAVTFCFDALSDFSRRRIRLSPRTAAFILLALLGMGLAVYSA